MDIDNNTCATLVVTDARPFADARSMVYLSSTRVSGAVETAAATVAAGFGATTGVALLPTRTAKRHNPQSFGTRTSSPPI